MKQYVPLFEDFTGSAAYLASNMRGEEAKTAADVIVRDNMLKSYLDKQLQDVELLGRGEVLNRMHADLAPEQIAAVSANIEDNPEEWGAYADLISELTDMTEPMELKPEWVIQEGADYERRGGKIIYRDEEFPGFNEPKKYTGDGKYKFRVLAKDGDKIKVINFGHVDYEDYTQHKDPERRKNFRSRMGYDPVKSLDKLSKKYWACQYLW